MGGEDGGGVGWTSVGAFLSNTMTEPKNGYILFINLNRRQCQNRQSLILTFNHSKRRLKLSGSNVILILLC